MYSAFCCRVPDRRAHWKWIPHSVFYTLVNECENLSVGSCSLQPCGLCSPWNSPGQNTGVSSLSLLQGIFPTQGSKPDLLHCRWILYQLSYHGSHPKRCSCESAALNMPVNLENSAVATGLEKVSFHSSPKERQCKRMLKLLHNCTPSHRLVK